MEDKNQSVNEEEGTVATEGCGQKPTPALSADSSLTHDEQLMEIEDCIEESIAYYVICDQCRSCTDVKSRSSAPDLFQQGWRIVQNDNCFYLNCPSCIAKAQNTNTAKREQTSPTP